MSGGMIKTDTSGLADIVMNTSGDMVDFIGGVRARLPIGSENDVMTVSSGVPAWEASSGGATTAQSSSALTSIWTTTSNSFVDVTGLAVTILDSAGGVAMVTAPLSVTRSSNGGINFGLKDDGVQLTTVNLVEEIQMAESYVPVTLGWTGSSDGSVIQLTASTGGSGNTVRVSGSTTNYTSSIWCIGVA